MQKISTIFFLFALLAITLATSKNTQVAYKTIDDLGTAVSAMNATLNYLRSYLGSFPQLRLSSEGYNLYNYMYKDGVTYSIFDAMNRGISELRGAPVGWDSKSYATALYGGLNILCIGTTVQDNGNGLLIHVPAGYDVLWVRVVNDRLQTFRIHPVPIPSTYVVEKYSCGRRGIIETSPDGAATDVQSYVHLWCPIALRTNQGGDYMLYSAEGTVSGDWISGLGFGKNLWYHAKQSAHGFYMQFNGGSGVTWNAENWNTDNLAQITAGKISTLMVPVVPTGRHKILYIAEHNNNWQGVMHGAVTINGKPAERFRTSYSNPFSKHISSKMYSRYMATVIPASSIGPNDKFVTLTIDMTLSEIHIHFREVGTHDYF